MSWLPKVASEIRLVRVRMPYGAERCELRWIETQEMATGNMRPVSVDGAPVTLTSLEGRGGLLKLVEMCMDAMDKPELQADK